MENSVIRLFRITAADSKQYEVAHYNLDMVLALGFRVRSPVGGRQWINEKLKEYLVKGFVLDDERLKNSGKGHDYFDELLRRLQDIRIKRCFYQKIIDYGVPDDELPVSIFATDECPHAGIDKLYC